MLSDCSRAGNAPLALDAPGSRKKRAGRPGAGARASRGPCGARAPALPSRGRTTLSNGTHGIGALRIWRRQYAFKELRAIGGEALRTVLSPRRAENLAKVKLSRRMRLERCLGLPINLYVEPTGTCNYRCIKCAMVNPEYVDDGFIGGTKNIPLEMVRALFDELGPTLLTTRLWHFGEPTLNRQLPEMVEIARRHKVFAALNTNGSRLDGELAQNLIDAKLPYLVVSCDSASGPTYARYHGADQLDAVVENISRLIRLREQAKQSVPFVDLQFIVMRDNESEVADIQRLAAEMGVDKLSVIQLDTADANFHLRPEIKKPEDLLPRDARYHMDLSTIDSSLPCRLPWEEAVVRYSGVALPCVTDQRHEHVAGSVFDPRGYHGFAKVWNGEAFRRFRGLVGKNDGSMPLCNGCAQRNGGSHDHVTSFAVERAPAASRDLVTDEKQQAVG